MSQIVPTQNGYIDTDPFGFKQAQDMGMRLQERADQHQQFLQDQVLNNQKMSVQDIMNHLNLAKDANPVDAQGNVNVPAQPTVDRVQSIPPAATPNPASGSGPNAFGDSQALDSLRSGGADTQPRPSPQGPAPAPQAAPGPQGNAVQDSNVLDQLRSAPPTSGPAPQQFPDGSPGASLAQLLNLPQTQTNYNPGGQQTTRPANPSHVVTYSDANGTKLKYEMKAPQQIQQQAQDLEAQQGAFARGQKAMDITSEEMAKNRGQMEVRKEMLTPTEQGGLGMGVPIGAELGAAWNMDPKQLVLPSELQTYQEIAAKTEQAKNAATTQGFALAAQMAGTAQNQDDWNAMRARLPASVAGAIPALYSSTAVASVRKMGVPIASQPEFDLATAKASAMQALATQDPASLDAQVDSIVPQKDPMNAPTKALIHAAASRPDALTAIPQIMKDIYDQRGRVQVAKETKQNSVTIDMGGGPGSGLDSLAQGIANYHIAPLSGFALARPQGQAVMARVNQLNPDYHAEYFNNFNKTESDATTGKIGTAANAINTAMGHLGVLSQASDALAQNSLPALNAVANWVGVQTGQDPVTTYNTIVHRIGPEVTKAYLSAGGSVGERGTNEADFDPKLSPAQRKANIGASALLFGSKIDALNQQYQRGTYGQGKQELISPEAQKTRQLLTGLAPGGLGGTQIPPAVQKALSTVGTGIHTLSDGSKWMKAPNGTITKQ